MTKQKPIKFILNIIKENNLLFSFSFFCALIWGFFISFQSFILKNILDVLENTYRCFIYQSVKPIIYTYLLSLFFIIILFRFQEYFSNCVFMPRIRKKIINYFFSEIITHNYEFFQKNSPGEITDRIKNVSSSIIELLKMLFDDIIYYIFSSVTSIFLLFKTFSICGFITASWICFFVFVIIFFIDEILKKSEKNSNLNANIFGNITDVLLNIITVKLFHKYDFEKKKLDKSSDELLNSEKKIEFEYTKVWSFYTLSFFLVQILSLYFLIKGFILKQVTLGDFALVWSLNTTLVSYVWKFARDFAEIQRKWGKINDAFNSLLNFENIKILNNKKSLNFLKGKIEFKNISFSYSDGKNIFNNFSLTINPKEKIGIVGYSGSGKTTLINLLLGLFKLNSGSIEIDEQNINFICEESLKKYITLISQNAFLFNRTISENVDYGDEKSLKELKEALKNAEALDFVENLENKTKNNVGEGGSKLSGGQRQRIILARAFLKNSEILILDEATSSLDMKTEKIIQTTLNKLMKNKTVIVIAHRLSTLIDMDRIIVLNDGKIVQDGKHEDLIKKKGLYKELWKTQSTILID